MFIWAPHGHSWLRLRAGYQLLAAVDVIGPAGEGFVAHDVNREGCYVSRLDDPPDGEGGAELGAAIVEVIAQERCGQSSIDEAGGDEVDSDRRQFKSQAGSERWERCRKARDDGEAHAGRRPLVVPMNSRVPPGRTL